MDISTEIAAIQAASRGSEVRQPIVDALNKLNTGALPAVTSSDAGKILKVNSDGEWVVGEKSGYIPTPSGTFNISANGTFDVTNYASVVVNVSGGGSATLITKEITANGTYSAQDDNADGYSQVTVNVGGGELAFTGDGREYYFDFLFGGSYEFVYISTTGVISVGGYGDEIDGEFIHKAASSYQVTAKKSCKARIGTTSSLGNESSYSANNAISSSISGYDRLIVAYDANPTREYEFVFGWIVSGSSTQNCVLKRNGTLVAHSVGGPVGDISKLVNIGKVYLITTSYSGLTYRQVVYDMSSKRVDGTWADSAGTVLTDTITGSNKNIFVVITWTANATS